MAQIVSRSGLGLNKMIAIALILFTIVGSGLFYLDYLLGPVDAEKSDLVEINIPHGSSVTQIARSLEEVGAIRKSLLFIAFSRFHRVEGKLQAGYYQLDTGMSVADVVDKIVSGEVATQKLTIPEGLTVKEMAPLIAKKTRISPEAFLQAAQEYQPDFLPRADVEFPVEGFLFPDTYQIPLNATAIDLIETMLQHFKKYVGTETVSVNGRPLSLWEWVTIASLVEEEAKLDGDRPLIAGVIFNRLEKGMNLQLCASVLYVLGVKKERLSGSDTQIESPYNTYNNPGLPPGPISNPGMKSIQAVLNPEENPYLFYFALPDGTTYYTRTYQEHLEAIDKYLN